MEEFRLQAEGLKRELYGLSQGSNEIIPLANNAIVLCRDLLNTFKQNIAQDFESIQDEIYFFKEIKQVPLSYLIYYSEIRSFEIQFPKANRCKQEKFIKKKLNKVNRFYLYNMDFCQYVESKSTDLDDKYYTRNYLDLLPITFSKHYFQDPAFSTSRDLLLGKYNAYNILIDYLQNRLKAADKRNGMNGIPVTTSNLKWTSSKTAMTELIYALYCNRAINNGEVDIKEIASTMEKVLNFDLGDFYKTYSEIKSRKMSRTKFLDDLSSGLLSHMINSEE